MYNSRQQVSRRKHVWCEDNVSVDNFKTVMYGFNFLKAVFSVF
jgi:hypothetical protein